jgi:hypothetical protein
MSGTFNSFRNLHKAACPTELNAFAKSKYTGRTEAPCVQQPPGLPSAGSAPASRLPLRGLGECSRPAEPFLRGVLQAVPLRKAVQMKKGPLQRSSVQPIRAFSESISNVNLSLCT